MKLSIVTPVYNQWSLTKECLESLARTLPGDFYEVFIVDNASTDETPDACPALGRQLFGERFIYQRFPKNQNFGPATNWGAQQARGEYLLLLNNDITLTPGWLEPLLQDFYDYPMLGATGPLLLYPEPGYLGYMVQHLGVYYSPFQTVDHLYAGIPADSPLAGKRRFFQITTAACQLWPRALFLEDGGFDERYRNGFEDVELCARMALRGWRMTVNPASRIFHHASQSPGRHQHERYNSLLLSQSSLCHLKHDYVEHLREDGYQIVFSPWLGPEIRVHSEEEKRLDALFKQPHTPESLRRCILEQPFWRQGYLKLAQLLIQQNRRQEALSIYSVFRHIALRPDETLNTLLLVAPEFLNPSHYKSYFRSCLSVYSLETYAAQLESHFSHAPFVLSMLQQWKENMENDYAEIITPFCQKLGFFIKNWHESLTFDESYLPWKVSGQDVSIARHLGFLPAPASNTDNSCPRFGIFLFWAGENGLKDSLKAMEAQNWPHWRLWIVPERTLSPEGIAQVQQLAQRDSRIELLEIGKNKANAINNTLQASHISFAAFLMAGDVVEAEALALAAAQALACDSLSLIRTDEDILLPDTTWCGPSFNPLQWDPARFLAKPHMGGLSFYATDALLQAGGWQEEATGLEEYSMLLRMLQGVDPEHVRHIPQVLLHRKQRAKKSEQASQQEEHGRLVRNYLKQAGINAYPASGPHGLTLRYQLQALPHISLVLHGSKINTEDWEQKLSNYLVQLNYPLLQVLVVTEERDAETLVTTLTPFSASDSDNNTVTCSLLTVDSMLPFEEQLNLAAAYAEGDILVFLDKNLVPSSSLWLRNMAAHLLQPGIGMVGGTLVDRDGCVIHMGYAASHDKTLVPRYAGLESGQKGEPGPGRRDAMVTSLDERCLFVRREDFQRLKGFNRRMEQYATADLCLRLQQEQKQSVISTSHEFQCPEGYTPLSGSLPPLFQECWEDTLLPEIPALTWIPGGCTLHWPNVEKDS